MKITLIIFYSGWMRRAHRHKPHRGCRLEQQRCPLTTFWRGEAICETVREPMEENEILCERVRTDGGEAKCEAYMHRAPTNSRTANPASNNDKVHTAV